MHMGINSLWINSSFLPPLATPRQISLPPYCLSFQITTHSPWMPKLLFYFPYPHHPDSPEPSDTLSFQTWRMVSPHKLRMSSKYPRHTIQPNSRNCTTFLQAKWITMNDWVQSLPNEVYNNWEIGRLGLESPTRALTFPYKIWVQVLFQNF